MTFSDNNLQFASSPDNFSIDRVQATTQLEALGFKRGDAIYVRAFLPKEDPRYAPNTGRKVDKLNWKQIEHWQAEGYGIYIVVNGGGHKDADVKRCRAIFIEHDDLEIELQRDLWKTQELPEPTFQVQTRKSVHSYWVIEGGCNVEEWKPLQTDLLAYTNADPVIKNPSRVMRLAGAYHIKPGCEPLRCNIISNSGKKYNYEELRAAVPVAPQPSTPVPTLPLTSVPDKKNQSVAPQIQRYEDIQIPVTESVPLENCLAKESRKLLERGVSEGSRNVGGAKLARDLIGTANYLQSIGQRFDGEPRQLLEDYALRCTPPLSAREAEGIWKSAEKDRPTPSCHPSAIESCIRAWYWKQYVKPLQTVKQSNNHANSHGFGNSNDSGHGGGRPPVTAVSLPTRVKEILSRYETESLQVNALMELATATGRTYNEINQLAKIIRCEGDLASEVIEAVKSFSVLLKSCRKRLDVNSYLEAKLAEPLYCLATAMPTAVEYLFNTLLPALASRIGTSARVIINEDAGYVQPSVIWSANVQNSGQAKTPPQLEIIKALIELEAVAKQLYDQQRAQYESETDSKDKPPVRQRRLLSNVTTSTKIRIHEENPRGLLEYIDELVADYQRLNQYKGGKGDDLQNELTFWNGGIGNYDRKDAQLFLARTAFSKTGTYQWDTLARLMADEVNFIASGYSSRYLYCSVPDAPARYLDLLSERKAINLQEILRDLYEQLERLPANDYLLEREAKVLFQGWNHALVDAEITEKHFGLSLVYAKIESYTARIALILHIVNAVLRGEKPAPTISGETMQHAIEIASFYLWQHKLIHAHNAPERKLEGIFLKVQTNAEKFFTKCGKGVGASFLKTRINTLKNWAVEKIRTVVFKTLATAGHGRIEGEGSEMVYIPQPDLGRDGGGGGGGNNSPPHSPNPGADELVGVGGELVGSPIAEVTANAQFQPSVGEIGVNALPITSDQQPDQIASTSNHHFTPGAPELGGDGAALNNHQLTKSFGVDDMPAETVAVGESLIMPPIASSSEPAEHSPNHQFTNSTAQTTVSKELHPIGDTTNSSPTPPTLYDHQSHNSVKLLSNEQLQEWLDRIAAVRHADDCTSCWSALESLPKSVSEQIWSAAETLAPHFWEVSLIEAPHQPQQESGVGFAPKVSVQQPETKSDAPDSISASVSATELSSGDRLATQTQCTTAGSNTAELVNHDSDPATSLVVQRLVIGLWVRTVDGFFGHLRSMLPDGRWWVVSPKTRTHDATSRLVDAVDIVPMPL